jgi:hypothetical protein
VVGVAPGERTGVSMRGVLASVAVALAVTLGGGTVSAQPAVTTCALTGVYVLSAALALQGEAQFSGQFIFTPPGSCTAGAAGTVQFELSLLFAGNITPIPFAGFFPYAVDASGETTIGNGLIRGSVGGVAGTGIANNLLFTADPAIAPATVRFAGVAVRADLAAGVLIDTPKLNSAMGDRALPSNTTGHNNTAIGSFALEHNTTGSSNTAVGLCALCVNGTGSQNIAIGDQALTGNGSGSNNIAIGYTAGAAGGLGDNNIFIGNLGGSADANTIRIGNFATQTATFIAGIAGATVASSAQVLINTTNGRLGTAASARRFKEDIHDMGEASSGLLRLRPVTFRYRPEYDDGTRLPQYGLVAEEVAEVYPELVVPDSTGRPLTVRYHQLPAMLLNEVQREHNQVEAQQRHIEAQDRLIQAQQERLETQSARLAELGDRLSRLEALNRPAAAP